MIPWWAQKQDNINNFLSTWHMIGTNDFFGYFKLLCCNIKVLPPPQPNVELEVKNRRSCIQGLTPRCPRLTCITSSTQAWLGFNGCLENSCKSFPSTFFFCPWPHLPGHNPHTGACRTHRLLSGVPEEASPLLALIVLQLFLRELHPAQQILYEVLEPSFSLNLLLSCCFQEMVERNHLSARQKCQDTKWRTERGTHSFSECLLRAHPAGHCPMKYGHVCCARSSQLCLTLCDPMGHSLSGPPSMGFSRQEYWSGLWILPFNSYLLGAYYVSGTALHSMAVAMIEDIKLHFSDCI